MLNLKPLLLETLKGVCPNVFLNYSSEFTKLPCVSFYEASNSAAVMADDVEYLSVLNYAVDLWGESGLHCSR